MKRFFSLIVIVLCLLGMAFGAQAKKSRTKSAKGLNKLVVATTPKVDANGYYSLLKCPDKNDNIKVTATKHGDDSYKVDIFLGGKQVASEVCEATSDDVRFVDANFDGYYDVFIGPASSRTYNALFLWNPQEQKYNKAKVNDNLNGYFLLNPAKKVWVGRGSASYCSEYYTEFKWQGDQQVDAETLIEITDPTVYSDYGVHRRYTVIKGGDCDNVAKNRKQQTNKRASLPKKWRTSIKAFDSFLK